MEISIQASAAQSSASLELSLRSAMGAVPAQVTMLAALADGKLHALNAEGHVITLPELAAESCYTQRVWVRSMFASSCRLVAVLSCPAQVPQSAELHFVEPFEHMTRLTGELNVHALVAPSKNYAAVSSSAAADSTGGVPLVVGQVVFAQVLVRAIHAVELQLLGAQLELQQDAGLQVCLQLPPPTHTWLLSEHYHLQQYGHSAIARPCSGWCTRPTKLHYCLFKRMCWLQDVCVCSHSRRPHDHWAKQHYTT